MGNLFERLFNRTPSSADKAKERMKLVLIHDRTNLSSGVMDKLKDELIEVISRHIEIDPEGVQIDLTQEGREQRLIADIPLRSVRRRRVG